MSTQFVLAKRAKVEGDDACVTIHGYTDIAREATTWENASEDNVSFTVDVEESATVEPRVPNETE